MDEWSIKASNSIKEFETEVLFPEVLPSWFRSTEIGTILIPNRWASITKDILHKRKRLLLKASNLQHENIYTLKIDIS